MNPKDWLVTEDEYMGDARYPSDAHINNALDLLARVNRIRIWYNRPMIVSSGYRTPMHNAEIGGAQGSLHCQCRAIDIRDRNGEFCNWCLNNLPYIAETGLWMENPMYTPGWVHLDTRPRRTLVFIPDNRTFPAQAKQA